MAHLCCTAQVCRSNLSLETMRRDCALCKESQFLPRGAMVRTPWAFESHWDRETGRASLEPTSVWVRSASAGAQAGAVLTLFILASSELPCGR